MPNTKLVKSLFSLICLYLIAVIMFGCTGSSSGDGEGDSSPEIVISMNSEETIADITFGDDEYTIDSSDNDGTIINKESIEILEETEVNQTSKPVSYFFPDKLISFTINNLDPNGGETISVTINYPTFYPPEAKYYKVNDQGFEEYTNAIINGDTVTITLTDGGEGDSDDVLGQITDPGGPAIIKYNDNNFIGSWLIKTGSDAIYFIGDGQGEISEHSGIVSIFVGNPPSVPGTYHINYDGSFEIVINGDEGSVTIYGQLVSDSLGHATGDHSGWTVHKIADISACQGTWNGTLTPFNEQPIELSFSVDTSGQISHVSCQYTINGGRMYKQDEFVVFKMTTNDSNGPYNQISLTDGNLSGAQVNGTYHIDKENNPAGDLLLFLE